MSGVNAEPNLLEEYLAGDPRKLSPELRAKAAKATGMSAGQVNALINKMGVAWEQVENDGAAGEPGAEALSLAHEIMRLEEAQKFSSLNSEDESSIQQIRDILKLDPELTREVAELVWSAGAVEPPSGAKTILPYWKAKSKKVAELASIEKEDFDD